MGVPSVLLQLLRRASKWSVTAVASPSTCTNHAQAASLPFDGQIISVQYLYSKINSNTYLILAVEYDAICNLERKRTIHIQTLACSKKK